MVASSFYQKQLCVNCCSRVAGVMHLVDEVERVADRVGIIHYGRLRFEGSIDVLRASVREVAYDDPAAATDATAAHPTREQVLQLAETHGLTLLREGLEGRRSLLLDGEPSRWDAVSFPANAVRQLSLEDIFIAMASEVPLSV